MVTIQHNQCAGFISADDSKNVTFNNGFQGLNVLNVQHFPTDCSGTYRKIFFKQNEPDLDYSGFYMGF